MTPHLSARFHLPAGGHRPVEQRVVAGDPLAAGDRLGVLQERREPPDNPAPFERLGDLEELL